MAGFGIRLLGALVVSAVLLSGRTFAVSIEEEKELGREFALEAGAALPLLRDPDIVAYVASTGHRIVGALGPSPFEYQFAVLKAPQINAFAVPGGYVYVHSGLLTRVANDEELAGVLGHEIAHVHAHHLARQREATQLMNYATLLGIFASIANPALGAAALGASAAVQLKYSREFEQEADYLGARYMRDAGFDPRGMLDFFQKLWEEQRTTPTFLPPYLLSHPLTDERLTRLEAVLRTAQWERVSRPPASLSLHRAQLVTRARTQPPNEVVASYRRLLAEHPEDPQAHYLLGFALLETGSYEQARLELEQARQQGWMEGERELGRALLRLRRPQEARAALARAAEQNPADALAQAELGKALELLGETDAALQAYRRAVQEAPDFDEAHYQLGMLAGRTGQEGIGIYHLAVAYQLRGDYPQAVRQYEKALPLLPSGPERERAQENLERLEKCLQRKRLHRR